MISASIVSTSLSTDEYSMGWKTQLRRLIDKSRSMAKGCSPCSIIGWKGTMISSTLQLQRRGLGIGDVGDNEFRQASQQPHRLCEVLGFGLVEVEDDGNIAPIAQLIAQPFQHRLIFCNRPNSRTPLRPTVSMTSRIFSLWSRR